MTVFMISSLYSTIMAVDTNVFDEILRYAEKTERVSDKLDKPVGSHVFVCHKKSAIFPGSYGFCSDHFALHSTNYTSQIK